MKNLQLSDPLATEEALGRKSVTRRVITKAADFARVQLVEWDGAIATFAIPGKQIAVPLDVRARYVKGNVVYHGEALKAEPLPGRVAVWGARYRRDDAPVIADAEHVDWRWQRPILPARFCPTQCARRFSRIVDVEPMRLGSLSDSEAIREGFPLSRIVGGAVAPDPLVATPRKAFEDYWRELNGAELDPATWVWRIQFESITREQAEAEAG